MAGLLEQLLAGYAPTSFDALDAAAAPPVDPAAEAEGARGAWAEKVRGGVKRRPAPFTSEPVPFQNTVGLLSGMVPPVDAQQPGNDLPPSTNDPASSEPVVFSGGVPLPRPRPVTPNAPAAVPGQSTDEVSSAGVEPGAIAPAAAATRAAVPTPPPPAFGGGGGGLFGGLLRQENAPLLLALGGGLAGAPSLGTGMRRAFSGAAPAAMQLQQNQTKLTGQKAIYDSLIAKGVPPAEAIAAATNPEMLKIVGAKYFETKPRTHVVIKDALGNETHGSMDAEGRYYDTAGKLFKPDGDGGSTMGSANVFAPGVKKLDPNLSGDEMLAQYHPDVQAAVKAYINGDVMPSGNPRSKGIADLAKRVAIRYGADTGVPVSDALFSERRKYRTELGSNSANSAGGQAKAFQQGVEHAEALAKKLEQLGNVDPVGIPSVSRGLNTMREAFSTKQSGVASEARALGQTLAGEVGKLFSGSAGGGVHERELTRNRFNTVSSPHELAGALEGTLETMEGGLRALEQRRDQILGPNHNAELVNKATRDKINNIRETITRLREGKSAPAAPAAPPSGKTGTGVQWSIVQ